MYLLQLALLLALAGAGLAKLYTSVTDLPTDVYDFIVVGGGTAGNVVANRLTENANFSVLVLEAGPSAEGSLNYTIPLFYMNVDVPSPRDWNYTLAPQLGLNGRVMYWARGKLLGGCSSMNGMEYVRGSSDDYNGYAQMSGDSGWSWDSLQPYIRKNEQWTAPVDGHNTTGQFDPRVHGFHGINYVTIGGFPSDAPNFFLKAAKEVGDGFHFNLDPNSGNQLGVGWFQHTIRHGKRSSSATSYLGPKYINRPNLHVLVQAQVARLSEGGDGPFSVVEFASSVSQPRHRVSARKEVILSAGPLETPHILMLSGVGDADDLTSFGIKPLVHLPDVGKNLSVHARLTLPFFANTTQTFDDIFRNATLQQQLVQEWTETDGGGPLSHATESVGACLRFPANASIFQNTSDPTHGPHTCHVMISSVSGSAPPPPQGYTQAFGITQRNPTSRGTVKLNTTSPFDNPIIDTNCLSTDWDVFVLTEGVKTVLRFITAPAWKSYILGPQTTALANLISNATDTATQQYVRNIATPDGHVVGSASMSPKGASWGVVDPDLRVKGVKGLRVIDTSVLPYLPAANTQFAAYMVGERGADLIKDAW